MKCKYCNKIFLGKGFETEFGTFCSKNCALEYDNVDYSSREDRVWEE